MWNEIATTALFVILNIILVNAILVNETSFIKQNPTAVVLLFYGKKVFQAFFS